MDWATTATVAVYAAPGEGEEGVIEQEPNPSANSVAGPSAIRRQNNLVKMKIVRLMEHPFVAPQIYIKRPGCAMRHYAIHIKLPNRAICFKMC